MQGFRAAEAYVAVTTRIDDADVLDAGRRAAAALDASLQRGARDTGQAVTEILSRSGGDAGTQLAVHAERSLAQGRARFVGAGTRIGTDVVRGAADESDRSGFRAFLGLIKSAPGAGMDMASGLMGALRKGMKGPAGPYMLAALGGAAVTTGPLVGAILASGIGAGLATGAIGAGIALAVQDPEIKHAAGQTGERIGDTLKSAAVPFKGAVMQALADGEAAVRRWEPSIRRIFASSAGFLRPLTAGITGLVDKVLPAGERLIARMGPTFASIASGLTMVGIEIGGMFDSLSDNAPEMAAGMTAAFALIAGSVRTVAQVVNGLTETFGFFMEMTFKAYEMVGGLGAALQTVPGPVGEIGDRLVGMSARVAEGKVRWDEMKNAAHDSTSVAAQGVTGVSDRTALLALSMGAAVTATGSLSAAFQALNGHALNAREAESAYQAAIDGVTASIKQNGKTLDLNTEKGRANDAAIRTLISSVTQKAQAVYDETAATQGSAAAERAAAGVYEQGRKQLIKNLTQILGNADAARELANKIMGIPKHWGTEVNLDDKATPVAKRIRQEIQKIHGKTVPITIVYETHGKVPGEHIIGQGTQVKAAGGWITGGSGLRDDVPVLAMGGEYMIKKRAAAALERTFGRGILDAFNNWDTGRRPTRPSKIEAVDPAVAGIGGVQRAPDWSAAVANGTPGQRQSSAPVFGAGSVTFNMDMSKIQNVADLIRMMDGLRQQARSLYGPEVVR